MLEPKGAESFSSNPCYNSEAIARLEPVDANRERRLPMINHNSPNSQMPICNALLRHTIGICFAILAWCPAGRAQTNNPAPASAEEVEQLREVVQSLLTRVTELEKELKERHPAAAATTERNSGDSNATRADAGATVFPLIPAFYYGPASLDEMAREFAYRVLAHVGLPQPDAFRWKG